MAESDGVADTSTGGARVVREAWTAIASRDADRIAAMFTPDAEWLAPADNAAARAMGGEHHFVGRDRIVRFLAHDFRMVFADAEVDVRGFLDAGSTVVVEHRMRAIVADDRPYDVEYCFVLELRAGRIHRVREYLDTARGAAMFAGS